MPQAIAETLFDIAYLVLVITAGVRMWRGGRGGSLVRRFGVMAALLGAGDAFHLLPRVYALWSGGVDAHAAALGVGKLVTSITMTVFYVILYYIWRERYHIKGEKHWTAAMWALAALRGALCLLPQNRWLDPRPPLAFGILRNLPFAAIGVLIIVLFAREIKKSGDPAFRWMPLAVALSFAFYLPVVLWAERVPAIGMLMIPKTLCYVWIVGMGWKLYKQA